MACIERRSQEKKTFYVGKIDEALGRILGKYNPENFEWDGGFLANERERANAEHLEALAEAEEQNPVLSGEGISKVGYFANTLPAKVGTFDNVEQVIAY